MTEEYPYTIKFAILEPHTIDNKLQPKPHRIKKWEQRNQFYTKLEASIVEEGFRNPINVWMIGKRPACFYGGSRLWVAQKLNLPIPCIISDTDNYFPDAKILKDILEVGTYFKDQPHTIRYEIRGLFITGCDHTHLE